MGSAQDLHQSGGTFSLHQQLWRTCVFANEAKWIEDLVVWWVQYGVNHLRIVHWSLLHLHQRPREVWSMNDLV